MNTTASALQTAPDTLTADAAVATVTALHSDVLGISGADINHTRADAAMRATKVQTTTELLLLLARFHEGVEDAAGAAMLARFAVEFAALEATVI